MSENEIKFIEELEQLYKKYGVYLEYELDDGIYLYDTNKNYKKDNYNSILGFDESDEKYAIEINEIDDKPLNNIYKRAGIYKIVDGKMKKYKF